MALSKDYLETLKGLAQARYEADVGVTEGEFKRRAGGVVSKADGRDVYKSPAQIAAEGGTPEYGQLDIAYERNRQGLEGGLESRGLLRSGQAATSRGQMATDYQQSVLDYYNAMVGKKGALGAKLAFDIADLEAKYGTQPQEVAPERTSPTGPTPEVTPMPERPTAASEQTAAQRSPEASAAFMALGQPQDITAATGKPPTATPMPQPSLPIITEPYQSAAYMALGGPASAANLRVPKPKPKPTRPGRG